MLLRMNNSEAESKRAKVDEDGRGRMGKGNPIGKDAVNVSANVPGDVHAELLRLAKESGVGISTYCRRVLIHAAQTKSLFDERTVVVVERRDAPTAAATASSVQDKTAGIVSDLGPKRKAP